MLDPQMLVLGLLVIAIAWFLSQYARNTIPRLLFIGLSLYLLAGSEIPSFSFYVAIGFLLPHLLFLKEYLQVQYHIFKDATINSYYFLLTIYGKVLGLVRWLFSLFEALKIFISTFSFKRAKQNYERENPHEDFYKEQARHEKFEQEYRQHQEEAKSSAYQSKSDASNIFNPTDKKEFERYFSKSKYEVLGVDADADYQEISKAYKTLAKMFHPDIGTLRDETGLVIKRINLAYDCVKAHKKGSTTHRCEFCSNSY